MQVGQILFITLMLFLLFGSAMCYAASIWWGFHCEEPWYEVMQNRPWYVRAAEWMIGRH